VTVREESAARDNRQDTASPFRPHVLQECATVPDGERGALVGSRGDIAWMCAPRWYSDGVFSALIGGSNCYPVISADPRFVGGGYYEDRSLIWRSRWITSSGVIECARRLPVRVTPRLRSCCAGSKPSTGSASIDPEAMGRS
jgi:Domain of unknown function (DUF5911)